MSGDVHDPEWTDGPTRTGAAATDTHSSRRRVIDLSNGGRDGARGGNGQQRPDGSVDPDDDSDLGTRERIVQAAAEVFLEKGFTGTRVVDIARRAGFTSGALYGYFDSRAELLAEAVAHGSSQMLSRLLGAARSDEAADGPGATGEDPMAVLRSVIDGIADPIDESDQMLLDGIALAHREPVAGDRLATTIDQFRAELADEKNGGLGEDAADMMVVLVLGITAARALGWHTPPSEAMRQHIVACMAAAAEATAG